MSRVKADKIYTNFIGGLITEAGILNFPEGASSDELNMIPNNTKTRVRRLGMNYEKDAVLTSLAIPDATLEDDAISRFEWRTVGGNALVNFLVIQINGFLYFYDSSLQPLSTGQKSFSINLNSFLLSGLSNPAELSVSMDSGIGYLFVTSPKLNSFYVKYDEDGDSITSTQITLEKRDFEGLDDALNPDEAPVTQTDEHEYNLKNQGWVIPAIGEVEPIASYKSATGEFPPNSKQWWTSKNTSDVFDPAGLQKLFTGNALAPKGHYVVDVLNIDRTAASGTGSFDPILATEGPSAIAFFASRVWYGLGNTLYFSQIVDREGQLGKCYQEQDPTAEILNELVDTDGGTVLIPDMGRVKALFVSGNSVIVYANNGTWSINGSIGSGFTPTDFVVDKISDIGIASPDSLVDVEGSPIWWAKSGIYTISRSETTDRLTAQSLTENTIKAYFDGIPEISREFCSGDYDELNKKVQWVWKSTEETTSRYHYDMILLLDITTGGFYPQMVSSLASESPYIVGVFSTQAVNQTIVGANVVDSSGNQLVTVAGDNIIANIEVFNAGQSSTKYIAIEPDTPTLTNEFTFSALNDAALMDWRSKDTIGITYDSYLETGDITEGELIGKKQINYLLVYLDNNVNEAVVLSEDTVSCLVQTKWDFTNSGSSGQWSRPRQAYRNLSINSDATVSKMKARGSGKGLRYRFSSEEGKDLRLAGWATSYGVTTNA